MNLVKETTLPAAPLDLGIFRSDVARLVHPSENRRLYYLIWKHTPLADEDSCDYGLILLFSICRHMILIEWVISPNVFSSFVDLVAMALTNYCDNYLCSTTISNKQR